MGDFKGNTWHIYLNQDAKERRDEIINHLEGNYDGPSEFVKQKLEQETALNIEERIERAKSEKEEYEDKIQRLQRIKQEREEQSALRDKKELLVEKQKKLRKVQKKDLDTEEEILRKVKRRAEEKVSSSSQIDSLEDLAVGIDERVRRHKAKQPDLDELVEEIERLQSEICELNNGENLDCFLDLEVEVK